MFLRLCYKVKYNRFHNLSLQEKRTIYMFISFDQLKKHMFISYAIQKRVPYTCLLLKRFRNIPPNIFGLTVVTTITDWDSLAELRQVHNNGTGMGDYISFLLKKLNVLSILKY